MSTPGNGALEQALAYAAAPGLLPSARASALPDDVLMVLRLAASDQGCLSQQARRLGLPASKLHDASVFYIQQVLFAQGADSYRVLGVDADAPDARLREHYRWLVRWLHPDRNNNAWEDVYLDRVHRAWQQVRNPERRRVHDLANVGAPRVPATGHKSEPVPRVSPAARLPPSRSPSRSMLPMLGFASALIALIVLVASNESGLSDEGGMVHATAQSTGAVKPSASARMALLPMPETEPVTMALPANPVPVDTGTASVLPLPAAVVQAQAMMGQPAPSNTSGMQQAVVAGIKESLAEPSAGISRTASLATPQAQSQRLAATGSRPALASTATTQRSPVSSPVSASRWVPAATAPLSRDVVTPESPVPQVATALVQPLAASRPTTQRGNAPVPAQASPSTVKTLLMNDRLAFSLVQKFRRAYNEGNLEQLMALFARDARDASGGGRQVILESFRSQFEGRQRMRLTLGRPDWQVVGQQAVILSKYRAHRLEGSPQDEREVNGSMRFETRQEDGELRIVHVQPERF